jgi:general stress protein YciG
LADKALYELRRTGGHHALVTMCIGGGQGIAAIFERIQEVGKRGGSASRFLGTPRACRGQPWPLTRYA